MVLRFARRKTGTLVSEGDSSWTPSRQTKQGILASATAILWMGETNSHHIETVVETVDGVYSENIIGVSERRREMKLTTIHSEF